MGGCPAVLHELDGARSDAHPILTKWEVAQMLWAHFHIGTSVVQDYQKYKPVSNGNISMQIWQETGAESVRFGSKS